MPSTITNKMENQNNENTMKTNETAEHEMCCAIAEWFETGYVFLYKYPEKFHKAIWSQGAIG